MNTAFSEAMPSAQREVYEGMESPKLPAVLFHATTVENAELIATQGLRPNQSIPGQSTVVCLSDTVGYALFCAGLQQEIPEDELVVLGVDTKDFEPDTYRSWLDKENRHAPGEKMHEVQSTVPISVDAIRRLSDAEVHEVVTRERQ